MNSIANCSITIEHVDIDKHTFGTYVINLKEKSAMTKPNPVHRNDIESQNI